MALTPQLASDRGRLRQLNAFHARDLDYPNNKEVCSWRDLAVPVGFVLRTDGRVALRWPREKGGVRVVLEQRRSGEV